MVLLKIDIPGYKTLSIDNVVLDMNGTIATDGAVSAGVKERIARLASLARVYVVTADTQGTAARELEGLPVTLKIFTQNNSAESKRQIVAALSGESACIGNGNNDRLMFREAALSIAVMGDEGVFAPLLADADMLVRSGVEALELLLSEKRLIAGLRD